MRIAGEQTIQSAELAQFLEIFMASSRQKVLAVQAKRDALDVRSSIFSDLRGKLTELKRAASEFAAIGALSPFARRAVSSSNAGILSATASAGAAKTTHAIRVEQLARAHSVLSDRLTATATDIADTHAGSRTFTIAVGDVQRVVSVDIQAGATNATVLQSVATAINAALGTTARATAMADTDASRRLSIVSGATGSANSMTFNDTDGLLAALGLTGAQAATDTAGGWVHADLGNNELDAKLTVDGIRIVRSTNTIEDAIAGVTLTLKSTHAPADPDIDLAVTADTQAIKDRLQKFLDSYNEAHGYLAAKTAVDRTTFERGALAGDSGYRVLVMKLRTSLSGAVASSADPDLYALSQIGITASANGTFAVTDAAKLDTALAGDLASLESLFASDNGIASRLEGVLEGYTRAGGIIATSTDSVRVGKDMLDAKVRRMEQLQEFERERLIQQFGALQEATKMQQSMLQMLSVMTAYIGA